MNMQQALQLRSFARPVCSPAARSGAPVLKCRLPTLARLPVRVCAVHARQQQKQQTTTTPHKPSLQKKLQEKVTDIVKNTGKVAAIVSLALALVLGRCDAAHAARSAGRAGGFHSPAPSRGYSGGGGGYSGGYSGGGYSGGMGMRSFSTPYYRAPIIVPGPPIVYGSPGVMMAPGAAAGVAVSTGPDIVDIAIVSIFLVMAASAATGILNGDGENSSGFGVSGGVQPTLTRVQVGLVSLARELKADLDQIAARADTSDSRGLHHLLQEVVLALLRNPSYCIYGSASQRTTDSVSGLEASFNKASLKERAKFEQETLVNVTGAAPRRSSYKRGGSSKPDELIVVTMLVATNGKVDIPSKIDSLASLKQALGALGAVQQDQVLGVELMWTPQAEGDYYTKDEIVADYPNLRQL